MCHLEPTTWRNSRLALLAWAILVHSAWGFHSVSDSPLFCPLTDGGAQTAGPLGQIGPLGESERRLFADAADGSLDEHSLLTAAVVASGVDDPAAIRHYQQRFARWVEELRDSGAVAGSPKRRAQAVFEFMHRRILFAGYRLDCTDLTLPLDEGRYNCVSASVLFCCLAEQFGLDVRGLEVPGHAMSRLVLPDETLDVESTCPRWFRLIDDPTRRAELIEKATGFRQGDPAAAGVCREVSGVELVATIYYNRGVDLLGKKEFARAAAANARSLRLDPSNETARGNLLATLNNWAIDEGSSGRYVEAAGLLSAGFELDPEFPSFSINYLHVHRQWVDALCRAGHFDEALAVLARAARERPDEPWFAQAIADVHRRWASSLATEP
jgi:pentatricopeptide repeat protein